MRFGNLLKYLRAWWLKTSDRRNLTVRVLEMFVFAWLIPLAGFWLFPENPLGLTSGFPWSAAGPIIFAARYGSGWGLACALSAASAIAFQALPSGTASSSVVHLSLGTLIVSIIVGDVATAWRRRSLQAEVRHAALSERLERFAVDYHLLKVSHGQLERYLAGQRGSLRQTMQELQRQIRDNTSKPAIGQELLAMFAQFCSVQVAGLYLVRADNTPNSSPVATLGDMGALPTFDPLLRHSIASGDVASIKAGALARDQYHPELLAVVPIKDIHGKLYAVLAVRDMHFIAFQQQNLNIMALLGICIGNTLSHKAYANGQQPEIFMTGLATALHIAHRHSLESTLLCMQLTDSDETTGLIDHVCSKVRSLDCVWPFKNARGTHCLCILLPLTDEGESEQYQERLAESVEQALGLNLPKFLLDISSKQIKPSDSENTCINFITSSFGVDISDPAFNVRHPAGGGHVA